MKRKCKVCDPVGPCEEPMNFLYAVRDCTTGAVKIGRSVNVTRRLAQYRRAASGNVDVELLATCPAGCEFVAIDKEDRAIRRLSNEGPRIRGDWFDCEPETAIQIVRSAK